MSYYIKPEFDFIERTKEILEQYQNIGLPNSKKYEVTLLINCLVGLLILPQQHWYNMLPEENVSLDTWGIDEKLIHLSPNEGKTVKNIARHLRNSVAHYRFSTSKNTKNEIIGITFRDFDGKNNKTFEATISIPNLRYFLTKFSDYCLKEMKSS